MIQQSFRPNEKGAGTLYLVGTPIGNLEDMSYRAVRTLQEADWIAAEDTRQTLKLLSHFQISTRLVSYHEHNKKASGTELIRLLKEGASIALVSDAGMPAISDPGYELVKEATEQGLSVVPIPGANAALSALVASGLDPVPFAFVGFLPRDKKAIAEELTQWKRFAGTLIFYESPHRIEKTLTYIESILGNRRIAIARELTKRYEEWFRGTVADGVAWIKEAGARGEFCIVVSGPSPEQMEAEAMPVWWLSMEIDQHVDAYIKEGLDAREAIKQAAQDRGVPKREIYRVYHEIT